jgi:hypothetical protein
MSLAEGFAAVADNDSFVELESAVVALLGRLKSPGFVCDLLSLFANILNSRPFLAFLFTKHFALVVDALTPDSLDVFLDFLAVIAQGDPEFGLSDSL